MKRILSASPMILCLLYGFLPICIIIGGICGYDFILASYPVFIVALAVLSVILTMLLWLLKISPNKTNSVFSALLLPISIINGLCVVFESDWKLKIVFFLICCGCSMEIFTKFAHPTALKYVLAGLSFLLILLLLLLSFLDFIFAGFGCDTVVKSVTSPQNTYVAEVIDNDQGAIGGSTYVYIQNKSKPIDLLIGKFKKTPICVYTGKYGEFENMQIYWKDEHTIIINGKEYDIRK